MPVIWHIINSRNTVITSISIKAYTRQLISGVYPSLAALEIGPYFSIFGINAHTLQQEDTEFSAR
jgi:hypothetical protein